MQADDVVVRPLERADLGAAAVVHAACFPEPWSEQALAALLALQGCGGLLALVGEEPVGLLLVQAIPPEAEILTLCVVPAHARRGVARRMLRTAMAELAAGPCRRLLLEVAADNAAGLELYGGEGFHRVGQRPGHYRRPGAGDAEALILARELAPAE